MTTTRTVEHHPSHTDLGLLVLRLVLGILILLHGIFKLTHGIGGIAGMVQGMGLPAALAYGAYVGEVLGPVLLILGLWTRIGAALVAVNMLFAFALAHVSQLGQLNAQGGWQLELQGMYLFTAIALALTGGGRHSVDGARARALPVR
jgi:putative oxidoreductase